MASKALTGVLIGCAVLFFIGIVAIIGGGWFVKHKVEQTVDTVKNAAGSQDSEYGKRAAKLKEQYPFTAPADGAITEPQLKRYLEVRKAVYSVYKQHENEIQQMKQHNNPTAGDALNGLNIVNEVRMAQVKALEDQKMSPDEYTFMSTSVYVDYVGRVTKDAIQQSNVLNSGKALQEQEDAIDKQLSDPNLPEAAKKQLQDTKDMLEKQKTQAEEMKKIDQGLNQIPKGNLDLFRKYDSDIKQYAMSGLDMLGL